ncbi:MAG TPA: phosphohistidine phosphatase SixA [Burkholderiaceae bacterium]|nr:phosphohistidine phosphatase SixA [Burkholderiaceae bacterium]
MTMDLVLWRHAEAEAGEPDQGRKLTSKGQKQARRVAEWLHNRLPDTARIHSSPARQAQQTAQALAETSRRKFKTLDVLGPSTSADEVLRAIGATVGKGTLVLVGHQPTLGRIASRLITGSESDWPIKKGGVVWISHHEPDGDTSCPMLRAAISPDLA